MWLGRLLRPLRAGSAKLLINDPAVAASGSLDVSSPDFADGGALPAASVGPHPTFPTLRWTGIPSGTRDVLVVVEDADVPFSAPLVHLAVYGLRSQARGLDPRDVPPFAVGGTARFQGLRLGRSAGVGTGFVPVTPIPGHGPHRYVFAVFALDVSLADCPPKPSLAVLRRAVAGHVLAAGSLTGTAEN